MLDHSLDHSLKCTDFAWTSSLAADHRQEWLDSGVAADLVDLNVETLTDTATQPYADSLFPIAERLNWPVTKFGQPRSALRGWWVSGVDPMTWETMSWGRFKPDASTPVLDRDKQKPAKYLSPSLGRGSSRLILLRVPNRVWASVAARYQKPLPQAIDSTSDSTSDSTGKPKEFWQWIWQEQIPIVLTEGEKKAGYLLSLGYAAIALPGIFGGYRKGTGLIPDLAVFTAPQRHVTLCFDYEPRPAAARHLQIALSKLGQLLQTGGCSVAVASLPGPQKGVDDFGVAQGAAAVETVLAAATPLKRWQVQQVWGLTYPASLVLNQPYLDRLPYPKAGLVGVKSPKGTGKTTALQPLVREAMEQGRKVLVISHRIQLGRAICRSLGIDWIEEIARSDLQQQSYGLCVDSLHPGSQAQFQPQDWQGAVVILDEVEQVLWHALNSLTCYDQRVKILACLRELVQVVLGSGGLLIAQDADLSDVSLDYLSGLNPYSPPTPWIVINQWQARQTWPAFLYQTPNPAPALARLCEIAATGPVFLALDSQKAKGRWSSKNLERYLQSQFPDKRILRIDSETVADPTHNAYRIVDDLNQKIIHYDIVLATPTLGTGVSVDVSNHFQAVFGIFQGVVADTEVRQALARVRDAAPRYIWAAPFGPGKVGNGSPHYQDVIASTTRLVKANIALLKNIDFDIDQQTDPITLRTWAKLAARVNLSLWDFRQQLAQALVQEGHALTWITPDLKPFLSLGAAPANLYHDLIQGNVEAAGYEFLEQRHARQQTEQVLAGVIQARQQQQIQEAQAVSAAPELPAANYGQIKCQRAKTQAERCLLQKYELQQRYAVPITPDLKLQDDQGWFSQLQLHYYLHHDPALVRLRDYQEWQGHLERGNGKVALQDVRLLTAQVEALKRLGIREFLHPDREVRASDIDVQQLADYSIQYQRDLKLLFNLTVSDRMTPIEILQGLLSRLGIKLSCIRRDQASDGRRGGLRVYQYRPPQDQRFLIFAQWQERDQLADSDSSTNPESTYLNSKTDATETLESSPLDPPRDIAEHNSSGTGSFKPEPKQPRTDLNHSLNLQTVNPCPKTIGTCPTSQSNQPGVFPGWFSSA